MILFKSADKIDKQIIRIEESRAIFAEAINYFENPDYYALLPLRAAHINKLLCVADRMLFDVLPKLKKISKSLDKAMYSHANEQLISDMLKLEQAERFEE